jgi:hypothetical protein
VAPPLEVRADIDSDEETSIGGNVDWAKSSGHFCILCGALQIVH